MLVEIVGPALFIKKGDTGERVRQLQLALNKLGYDTGGVDSDFGGKTFSAVKAIQEKAGLVIDGVVGYETAGAIDFALGIPPSIDPAKEHFVGDPPWFVVAQSLLGIYEFPGGKDNPVILGWAKELGGMIAREYKHDSIPWCQLCVQYCLFKAGMPHLDSLWALDNTTYGLKLKGAARGCIGSKKRAGGGGHTFFVKGISRDGALIVLGGNQSDMVNEASMDPAEVVSYNWPAAYPLPARLGLSNLPIVTKVPTLKREE